MHIHKSYYMYDFRNVPEDELAVMTENEEHFWSKVAQDQIKKGNMTGWAMLERMGGSADEPNVLFYIGAGSKKNIDQLGNSFGEGSQNVRTARCTRGQSDATSVTCRVIGSRTYLATG